MPKPIQKFLLAVMVILTALPTLAEWARIDLETPGLWQLKGVRREDFRSRQRGIPLRFVTAEHNGTATLDARNSHIGNFQHVGLLIFSHGKTIEDATTKLLVESSMDGKNFRQTPLPKTGQLIKGFDGGYVMHRFDLNIDSPQRFLRFRFNIQPKDYWRLQLAAVAIGDEPIGEIPLSKPQAVEARELPPPGQVPKYNLQNESIVLNKFHARQLNSKEELDQTSFDDNWAMVELPDIHRNADHPGLNPCKIPTEQAYGFAYRAQISAQRNNDQRILLEMPPAGYVTTILVNKRIVKKYVETFLPQTIDITDYLQNDQPAELLIKTEEHLTSALAPDGKTLFPTSAMTSFTGGITKQPTLRQVQALRISDLAVSPLRGKLIIDATIVNQTGQPCEGKLGFRINNLNGKQIFQASMQFQVSDITTIRHEFAVNDELALWDIGQPNLYVAQATLDSSPPFSVRFGYRFVEIVGTNIHLNGRPIRLKGPWAHRGEWMYKTRFHGKSLPPKELYQTLMTFGMNIGRLHCQPFPDDFYDAADEAGFLLIAETAVSHRPATQASLDHAVEFVRHLRNHPSIVIWSGSNEFEHWISPRPQATMDFLVNMQELIHENDPSRRPVQHSGFGDANGKLDLVNIHYPAEGAGIPTRLYWTRNPQQLLQRNYKHNITTFNPIGKKPILYGEELIPGLKDTSLHYGEPALRDFYAAKDGNESARDKAYRRLARIWTFHARAEREQNIAMISPNIFYIGLDSIFVQLLTREFANAGAYPVFPQPVVTAGTTETRQFALFEDSGYPFEGTLAVKLDDATLITRKVNIPPCDVVLFPLELPIPYRDKPVNATLKTELRNLAGALIHQDETTLRIMPETPLPKSSQTIMTLGDDKRFHDFASTCGFNVQRIDFPLPASASSTLVVLPDMPEERLLEHASDLARFVAGGGNLVVLERTWKSSFLPGQATFTSPDALTCQGFLRTKDHPILQSIGELELKYWNDDLTVATQSALKTQRGTIIPIIDSDAHLQQMLLWEQRYGSGAIIVNHLHLLDNWKKLRQAGKLLNNILAYKHLPMQNSAEILGGNDDDFASHDLRPMTTGNNPANTLIVTGDAFQKWSLEHIVKKAEGFKNVIVLNPRQDILPKLAEALTGSAPDIMPTPPKGQLYFTNDQGIYKGITTADLQWGSTYSPTFTFITGNEWASSINGGRDAIWKSSDRHIIFLNLPFDRDVPNPSKKAWFMARILNNLNCQVEENQR